jgi:hypothetical protein
MNFLSDVFQVGGLFILLVIGCIVVVSALLWWIAGHENTNK